MSSKHPANAKTSTVLLRSMSPLNPLIFWFKFVRSIKCSIWKRVFLPWRPSSAAYTANCTELYDNSVVYMRLKRSSRLKCLVSNAMC